MQHLSRNLKRAALALAALLALAQSAMGAGFQTAEHYAAYVGQATAGLLLTENAGVVASLPAGMVRLETGLHVMAGITHFTPSSTYDTGTESGSTITEPVVGPHVYAVQHYGGNIAVGAGKYFPFNVDVEYKDDWQGAHIFTREKLIVAYNSLSGAYAINDNMSVGGSLNLIEGWVQLNQVLTVMPGTTVPVTLGGTTQDFGFNASFMYQSDNLSVGLNYQPQKTLHFEGSVDFDTSQAPGLSATFPDGGASVDIPLPSVLDLGVAWHDKASDPDMMVELNIVQAGWSAFKEIKIVFDKGLPYPSSVAERHWKDTLGIKIGGNYALSRSGGATHRLRAGFFKDEGVAPTDYVDPAVPDANGRTEFAVGYGFKTDAFFVDAAYFVVDFAESEASPTNEFPAKYKMQVNIFSISGGTKF